MLYIPCVDFQFCIHITVQREIFSDPNFRDIAYNKAKCNFHDLIFRDWSTSRPHPYVYQYMPRPVLTGVPRDSCAACRRHKVLEMGDSPIVIKLRRTNSCLVTMQCSILRNCQLLFRLQFVVGSSFPFLLCAASTLLFASLIATGGREDDSGPSGCGRELTG